MEIIRNFIPIILITAIVLYPEKIIEFTDTILGKIVAVALSLCLMYFIDIKYSIIAVIVILYYASLDKNEGFNDAKQLFREQNCKNGELKYKNLPVKTEMASHVFPELEFERKPCNPCDVNCDFAIIEEKMKTEEELIAPKNSNDWFHEVWSKLTKPSNASPMSSVNESFSLL